jgi:large subunit ribosomal protein L24e
MVIKTDLCAFSGLKIWPGHGQRFVRVDNRVSSLTFARQFSAARTHAVLLQNFLFVTKKTAKYFQMKRNPRKLPWTQFFRHLHRKGNASEDAKKNKVRRHATNFRICHVMQKIRVYH